jgi:hypothetical protein
MDLWNALGISKEAGLIAAALGIIGAVVMAAGIAIRRGSAPRRGSLHLDDRRV